MEPATRIRVQYRDEVIECRHAADTIKEVIIKLIDEFGLERVLQADQSLRKPYNQRLVTTSSTDFRAHIRYGNVYISRDRSSEKKNRFLRILLEFWGFQS